MMLPFLRDVGEHNMTWSILVLLREWYLSFAFCLKHFIRWLAIAVGHQKGSMVGEKRQTEEKNSMQASVNSCMHVCMWECVYMHVGGYLHIYSIYVSRHLSRFYIHVCTYACIPLLLCVNEVKHACQCVSVYVCNTWLAYVGITF